MPLGGIEDPPEHEKAHGHRHHGGKEEHAAEEGGAHAHLLEEHADEEGADHAEGDPHHGVRQGEPERGEKVRIGATTLR